MIIKTFVTTAFQQNTRVLACEETRQAICVDPGGDIDIIAGYLNENDLKLQAVTLTHAHLDHVGGTTDLHRSFPHAEIILHADDEDLYYALPQQPRRGIPRAAWANLGLNTKIHRRREGRTANFTRSVTRCKVLHCPGHKRGHVVLFEERERKVCRRLLFAVSIDGGCPRSMNINGLDSA